MLIKTAIVLICMYFGYKIVKVLVKKKLKKMFFPNGMPDEMFNGMGNNMGSGVNNGQMGDPENPPVKEADLIQCKSCEGWMPTPSKYQKKGNAYCSKKCLKNGPKPEQPDS